MADGLNNHEQVALDSLGTLLAEDADLGWDIAALPWVVDGITEEEEKALDQLASLAEQDPSLARIVSDFPWFLDSITVEERHGLGNLTTMSQENIALARRVLGFPWVADDITDQEWRTLANLRSIAHADAPLGNTVMGYQWIPDDITERERWVVRYLRDLAGADTSLAKIVVDYPWVADAITENERWALRYIRDVAKRDLPLGKTLAIFSWVRDDISEDERWALQNLSALAHRNLPVALGVTGYPWLSDGITDAEWNAIGRLADLAEANISLADTVADYPWLTDSITDDERWAVRYLSDLAKQDATLAKRVAGMPFLTASFEQHDRYALRSLLNLYLNYTDEYQILTTQGWFVDGLDDLEASFMMVFGTAGSQLTPRDLRDLIVTRHAESRTIDLPLAGQIQLIFFEPTEDPQNREIVQQIEDAIREIESFINVPFPMEEITLLFASPGESAFSENKVLGLNRGTHLVVDPGLARQGDTNRTIVHEIGHYYWSGASRDKPTDGVPLWFQEGGADFLASYVRDRLFDDPLAISKRTLEQRNIKNCTVRGIHDLQRLIDKLAESGYSEHRAGPFFICNYHYGEALFLNLFETLGGEAFRHAWTEIYQLTQSKARPVNEIEIYQAFRNNIPSDKLADLNSVYERWHGGEIPE